MLAVNEMKWNKEKIKGGIDHCSILGTDFVETYFFELELSITLNLLWLILEFEMVMIAPAK